MLHSQQWMSSCPINFTPVRQGDSKHLYFKLTSESTADGNCVLNIDTTGKRDTTTWYEIWEASVSISAMCVRWGFRGIITPFGM